MKLLIARYDGPWTQDLHQFTTLTGASAGGSWTARTGECARAKLHAVEERFRGDRCPECGRGVRVLPAAHVCAFGCGWEQWGRP